MITGFLNSNQLAALTRFRDHLRSTYYSTRPIGTDCFRKTRKAIHPKKSRKTKQRCQSSARKKTATWPQTSSSSAQIHSPKKSWRLLPLPTRTMTTMRSRHVEPRSSAVPRGPRTEASGACRICCTFIRRAHGRGHGRGAAAQPRSTYQRICRRSRTSALMTRNARRGGSSTLRLSSSRIRGSRRRRREVGHRAGRSSRLGIWKSRSGGDLGVIQGSMIRREMYAGRRERGGVRY